MNHLENRSKMIEVNGFVFVGKLVVLVSLFALGCFLVQQTNICLCLLGIVVIGVLYAHCIELQHQCLHKNAFKHKGLNRVVGFILGIPMLVSYSHYQARHMRHHRYIGTPKDSEFFEYGNVDSKKSAMWLIIRAFSLMRYAKVFHVMLLCLFGKSFVEDGVSVKKGKKIKFEYMLLFGIFLFSTFSIFMFNAFWLMMVWLIPALFVSEAVHYFIELPEHYGCNREYKDIYENTRTIKGSWLSFWLTNGNNFHVEHHLLPGAPVDKLPLLHREINKKIVYSNETYYEFFREVFARPFRYEENDI